MSTQKSIKKIAITGQSGYLGSLISQRLVSEGYEVHGIPRAKLQLPEQLTEEIRSAYAVINLAGSPILQRWTEKNKKVIYESRVSTTNNLVTAINNLPKTQRPKIIISASAIGIYKSGELHDERSQSYDIGFVGKVVQDWEAPISKLEDDVRKTIFRIGPVLGKNSQMISRLRLPFKLGLGARIGSGNQAFPFIHIDDLVAAFVWAIENEQDSEVYNLVAPQNSTNKTFTKVFARLLHRPAFLTIPVFVLRLPFGEAAKMLADSPIVSSSKLEKAGFNFRFPNIESTLKEIVE
ncbi:TIGR01777 family oxidoreductase [Maribellus sediminis]|uniref:TIGR01777 family oxidoreductase n=1 Tax=Maribellus sediminis TaxID=2696285 RepID=UPI001431EA9A|nr:TIGR01777 family oxidoreductase [Maribellus sediminis]